MRRNITLLVNIYFMTMPITLMAVSAFAGEAQFGFVYTTDLMPMGKKEVEQWLSWRHQKIGGRFDLLESRTEIEYGVTDRLQVALYGIYDWTQSFHNGPFGATTPAEPFSDYSTGPDDHFSAGRFVGIAGEEIYRVLSPYTDPVGLALYEEPTVGPKFFESESKLILQKNFLDDTLVLAFNWTYAPEFRLLPADLGNGMITNSWQEETDVNANFGASYRFMRNWSGGFEMLNEREFNSFNFTEQTNSGYFLGPSFHYGGKTFFVSATFLEQLPWATVHAATVPGAVVDGRDYDNDFEKYRVRVKVGFPFS
jgi:uncharacterized protein DUF6662